MSRASFTQPGGLRRVRPKQRAEPLPELPSSEVEACWRLLSRMKADFFANELETQLDWILHDAALDEWDAALGRYNSLP